MNNERLRRVVDIAKARELPPPALSTDPALLSRIIATQGELGRAGLDPRKVVDVVTRRAQELTDSHGAVVEMADGTDMVYWSASGSAAGQLGLRIPVEGSLSGLCVQTGRTLRCDDSEADPRVNRDACRRVGLRSAIVVPLTCDDHLVGVLKVVSPRPYAYTDNDADTLALLGSFIGTALHHALAHARLREDMARAEAHDAEARHIADAIRMRLEPVLAEPTLVQPVFQPIVELATGRTVGLEGLSRFPAEHGLPPDRWFADAAKAGVCVDLELLCARRVLEQLPRVPAGLHVAINLSPATLISPKLDALIDAATAPRLILEITETSEVEDYAALVERLTALKQRGARIAIDDAGAGFASLRHVLRLAPDYIKLDVSLTRGIDASHRHRTLAAAMLVFARDTDAILLAEGVETEAELATLRDLGVTLGQGYLLGRPAPL